MSALLKFVTRKIEAVLQMWFIYLFYVLILSLDLLEKKLYICTLTGRQMQWDLFVKCLLQLCLVGQWTA